MTAPLSQEFRAYVEQVVIPELSPGDVVVLDNLAAHKVAVIREMIQAAGAGPAVPAPVQSRHEPD